MKVFAKGDGWDSKVNFVDESNVFVGYEMEQACCEHADWFISGSVHKKIKWDELDKMLSRQPESLEGYFFDKSFHREYSWEALDEGGAVVFRLTNGKKEKFLHLFNCHNGYYGHGFQFKAGDQKLLEGYL